MGTKEQNPGLATKAKSRRSIVRCETFSHAKTKSHHEFLIKGDSLSHFTVNGSLHDHAVVNKSCWVDTKIKASDGERNLYVNIMWWTVVQVNAFVDALNSGLVSRLTLRKYILEDTQVSDPYPERAVPRLNTQEFR